MQPRGAPRPLRTLPLLLAAPLLAAGALPAPAADWAVNHEASQLSISVEIGGRRLFGAFQDWRAEIAFDPERPEACRVRVEVDVASLAFPDDMASSSAATEGESAEARVGATLIRSDFGVGAPVEEMVGLDVRLDARVVAHRLD